VDYSAGAQSSSVQGPDPQVDLADLARVLHRWLRARGGRCILRGRIPQAQALRAVRRDVRDSLREVRDRHLAHGLAELHRDRASLQRGCVLLRGQASGAEASATRR